MNVIEQSKEFCLHYVTYIKKIAVHFNLTTSQAICINLIPTEGISQSDLARKLCIDISTLSRNLEHLINLNLIIKKKSKIDMRSFKISLSTKGKAFYKLFNDTVQDELLQIYNTISIDEKEQLIEIKFKTKINTFLIGESLLKNLHKNSIFSVL